MSTDSRVWREGEQPTTYIGSLTEHIRKGYEEALHRHIEVNAVLIDRSLAYSKMVPPYPDLTGSGVVCIPDSIFGLRVVYTPEELPLNSAFVLTKVDNLPLTKDEQIERLTAENKELKEKIRRILEFCEDWAEEATQ